MTNEEVLVSLIRKQQNLIAKIEGMVKGGDTLNEVWLTKERFLEQFGMFTEDWLRRYGYMLPRTRATVTDEQTGAFRSSQWAYGRNAVQQMIAENRLDFYIGANGKVRGKPRE